MHETSTLRIDSTGLIGIGVYDTCIAGFRSKWSGLQIIPEGNAANARRSHEGPAGSGNAPAAQIPL